MLFTDVIFHDGKPIYEQIEDHIKQNIANGMAASNSKLPSSRELAKILGVSRNSVLLAYENLEVENVIYTEKGKGTFIHTDALSYLGSQVRRESKVSPIFNWDDRANQYARMAENMDLIKNEIPWEKNLISFKSISPDGELFDLEEFKKAFAYRISLEGNRILNYGYAKGYKPFIDYLFSYMKEKGVVGQRKDIIVTNGFTEGFEMLIEAFTNPGDYILCENPTHNTALRIMHLHGVNIVGVPMRQDGVDMEELRNVIGRYPFRFGYFIPSYHNPTGIVTGESKRIQIYELFKQYQVPIIEDGFTEELLYSSSHITPIAALDSDSNGVIYIGSFSKILFPGLRIGWIMGDERVISLLESVKRCKNIHTSSLDQGILFEYLQTGALNRQMKKMRKSYKERYELAKTCIDTYLKPEYVWGDGGLHLFLGFENVNTRELLRKCYERRVIYMPGDVFSVDGTGANTLRLGLSRVTPEEIEEGIRIIGECL
ncbi:MAG TPA: PLP-dependent aminotransferase family protein [Lachnospiraceae bacterium]|nr:PLP-dependent aminotransferase family protein [Lachnospiraceae bacterium]